MKCSTCGTDNPANARFCGNCRQPFDEESTESAPAVSGIGVGTVEVSFIEAIKLGYKNYFTFSGRATRAELWWFYLFSVISFYAVFFTCMIGAIMNGGESIMFLVFMSIPYPISFFIFGIPLLSLSSRRLHDTGRSGWWYLLNFVPFCSIIVIVWWCMRGNSGPNKYGADPRQPTS